MGSRTLWMVGLLLLWGGLLTSGLSAAPRPMLEALVTARAASASSWPQVRQQLVASLSAAHAHEADRLALNTMLGQARNLPPAAFQAQQIALRIKLMQASQGPLYTGWQTLSPNAYRGPLFDAHDHALSELKPSQLVARLREAKIIGVDLFAPKTASSQEEFKATQQAFPEFVHAFALMVPDPRTGRQRLSEAGLVSLQQQLEAGAQGIGELALRHPNVKGKRGVGNSEPADGPLALRVYDLAARFKVPVVIHVDGEYSAEVGRAAAHNSKAIIVWAHCGDTGAQVLGPLLAAHPNLKADISDRNPVYRRAPLAEQSLTTPNGQLKAEWKALLSEMPDRFLFGLDFSDGEDRDSKMAQALNYYRNLLGQLPGPAAEQIGYRNAQLLLARNR